MSAKYFAALNRLEKLTPLRFERLLKHFAGDAGQIWQASNLEWVRAGIEPAAVTEIFAAKATIDPDQTLAALTQIGARVLAITDPDYPTLLREIYAPPPVLLVRGQLPVPGDEFAIAVVGSRALTPYGRQATTELARELARAGVPIVSGLALGADAVAHTAAVELGARTIAVLGCGIDRIYPSANQKLAKEILARGGAIISEYPIGTEPTAYNFPQRNRIIAGLSRGVLVTEAKEKSGALITGELALQSNREVFAVPGSIFAENSAGTNKLIKSGARAVTSSADIFEALNLTDLAGKIKATEIQMDSPAETTLLLALSKEPRYADEITITIGLPASEVGALLSLLEMKGLAKNLGGGQWVRI